MNLSVYVKYYQGIRSASRTIVTLTNDDRPGRLQGSLGWM